MTFRRQLRIDAAAKAWAARRYGLMVLCLLRAAGVRMGLLLP
jgi:hypothetical protein